MTQERMDFQAGRRYEAKKLKEELELLKDLHRKEIEDAFYNGENTGYCFAIDEDYKKSGEIYYNETFEQ